VRPQVDDLIRRGWVIEAETGPGVRLTAAGRAAPDRVAERVRIFRARVTEGLSEQEYATLVALLERVAGNLTPA
jgi:DNA-binding MarR family transcriptional regulator